MKQQSIKAIVNGQIVLENGILWDGAILLAGDKIIEVNSQRELRIPEGAEIIDAGGAYVGPGFVDIHTHGGNGHCVCFETKQAADYMLRHGTTSLLATVPYEFEFETFLKAISSAKKAMKETVTVKGLNMEGPYINPAYGAHASDNPWRGPVQVEEFRTLIDEAGTDAKIWTFAAEREGILPFLEYAKRVNPGVVFSLGHSEATPAKIRALGALRPRLQTHAMCATGRLSVAGGTRGYGPDEYCLREPDVYTELISDSCGIHVNADMQQLLVHAKGIHRIVLITDSSTDDSPAPKGMEHVTDLNFDPYGGISGSKLTMNQACRNVMRHTNCGIAQAFLMASLNPAKVIGMDASIGSVEAGKQADLVFVDDRFNVKQVMLGGSICHFEN